MTLEEALELVTFETLRATKKHKPLNSAHEGYAVLLEEVDELWDEVKRNPYKNCFTSAGREEAGSQHRKAMRAEAVQVAAMAVRMLMDVL